MKMEIPKEITEKITIEAEKRSFDNLYALDAISFERGGEYGYSLAMPEIGELRKENENLLTEISKLQGHLDSAEKYIDHLTIPND